MDSRLLNLLVVFLMVLTLKLAKEGISKEEPIRRSPAVLAGETARAEMERMPAAAGLTPEKRF